MGAVLAIRRSVAAWLIALACAASAHGVSRPPPWSGGAARVTTFEADATRVARLLAGPTVAIECAPPTHWQALSDELGFNPTLTWAMTPLRWDAAVGTDVPVRESIFSPRACRLAAAFAVRPTERGARTCRHGTRTQLRLLAADRGRPRRVRVPILGECDDWAQKLLAVHVLSHETIHLAGVVDEAEADCLATQTDALVATSLGASPSFARSLAREYWVLYYRSQDRAYRTPDCRDGGRLDLYPRRNGWPTPATYPGLSRRVDAFVAGVLPSGESR